MGEPAAVAVQRTDDSTPTSTYTAADFTGDKLGCDLVMKGGITSGVVYPLAVAELAKKYRFRGIGGTSVGAIAAAVTAAAEYARDRRGFERLVAIPNELAGGLVDKFQPDPRLRPLFNVMLALLKTPRGIATVPRIVGALALGYWPLTLLAFLVAAAIWWLGTPSGGLWAIVMALVALVIGWLVLMLVRIVIAVRTELPEADFGLCSGQTIGDPTQPAFTDWLADLLDRIANDTDTLAPDAPPLTFKALEEAEHPVMLRMMTSDLAMGRPYELPLRDNLHFFSEKEFRRLFPRRVVDYMIANSNNVKDNTGTVRDPDLYYLPEGNLLPVIVGVRLSLSFPGLIRAVPLYKRDFRLKPEERFTPVRCLFSDGGLTSNFPIHMFDRLWPNSPTFAIQLDNFDERAEDADRRVRMHLSARSGVLLPVRRIAGIGDFFWALFNTAKDWQDNLQAVLPGYRERLVRIALKSNEGGLNLEMPPELITALTGYGAAAGRLAASEFRFEQHRWRRHITALAKLDETFVKMLESYRETRNGPDTFEAFLAAYNPDEGNYPLSQPLQEELALRTREIVELAEKWAARMTLYDRDEFPRPESMMRITPRP